MSTISNLISAHGFVDIYCGLALLGVIASPRVVQGYTQTFEFASAEMIRMIGYIMLMTGSVRMTYRKHECNILVGFSYLLEGYFYLVEGMLYEHIDEEIAFACVWVCLCISFYMAFIV